MGTPSTETLTRSTGAHRSGQTDRQTDWQADRQTDRFTNQQTRRQLKDRQTGKHRYIYRYTRIKRDTRAHRLRCRGLGTLEE